MLTCLHCYTPKAVRLFQDVATKQQRYICSACATEHTRTHNRYRPLARHSAVYDGSVDHADELSVHAASQILQKVPLRTPTQQVVSWRTQQLHILEPPAEHDMTIRGDSDMAGQWQVQTRWERTQCRTRITFSRQAATTAADKNTWSTYLHTTDHHAGTTASKVISCCGESFMVAAFATMTLHNNSVNRHQIVCCWDLNSRQLLHRKPLTLARDDSVTSVHAHQTPTGLAISAGTAFGQVLHWPAGADTVESSTVTHSGPVTGLHHIRQGDEPSPEVCQDVTIASVAEDSMLFLHNDTPSECVGQAALKQHLPTGVIGCYTAEGRTYLAVSAADRSVAIVDSATDTTLITFVQRCASARAQSLRISTPGVLSLAVGCPCCGSRIWTVSLEDNRVSPRRGAEVTGHASSESSHTGPECRAATASKPQHSRLLACYTAGSRAIYWARGRRFYRTEVERVPDHAQGTRPITATAVGEQPLAGDVLALSAGHENTHPGENLYALSRSGERLTLTIYRFGHATTSTRHQVPLPQGLDVDRVISWKMVGRPGGLWIMAMSQAVLYVWPFHPEADVAAAGFTHRSTDRQMLAASMSDTTLWVAAAEGKNVVVESYEPGGQKRQEYHFVQLRPEGSVCLHATHTTSGKKVAVLGDASGLVTILDLEEQRIWERFVFWQPVSACQLDLATKTLAIAGADTIATFEIEKPSDDSMRGSTSDWIPASSAT